jgi:beta-lactamase regulating signal transducer with metallopeptidase domain
MISLVQSLSQQPLVETIGWVLLHFIWQGAAVALIAAAILRLLTGQRSELRYAVALGALVVMFLLPLATFTVLLDERSAVPETSSPAAAERSPLPLIENREIIAGAEWWQLRAEAALPAVVVIWALGVVFLSLRLLSGLIAIELLARRTSELPAAVMAAASRLSDRLGIKVAVRFARSAAIEVPTVIGWLRPVVLVPASALTGLTPAQLETLLAHELAHIRRYDYFVNLLQSVVETALFYHPGVWWISKQIRAERENCCDDIVVDLYDDPLLYARALADLEALRALPAGVALAATGGSLRERVLRLVTAPEARCSQRGRASMVILLMTSLMLLVPMSLLGREIARHASTLQSITSLSPAQAAGIVIDVFGDAIADTRTESLRPPKQEITVADMLEALREIDLPSTMASAMPAAAPESPASRDTEIDREIDRAIQRKLFGVTEEYRAAIARAGYDVSEEQLVEFRIHGVTPAFIESINAAGLGRLSAKELVEFRIHGVTPAFIASMKSAGIGDLSRSQLVEFRIHGVTGDYIQRMRAAGLSLSAREFVEFRIHRVTPEFIAAMNAAGLGTLSQSQLVEFRIHGVTPEFIETMNAATGRALSSRELVELRVHRVSPETIRAAREMFRDASLQDVVAMKIHGVSPQFLEEMRARGYELRSISKATELRIHSVTPQFIDSLRDLGYSNIPLDELVRMRIFNVNADYIRRLHGEGLKDLAIDQMIRLRMAGVDPTELTTRRR